jgi:hypothetical protein
MTLSQIRPRLPAVLYLVAVTTTGAAMAQPSQTYEPQVGQAGKDVVWVPTAESLVQKMLDMAKAGPGDYVIDLGSGDGRTVIAAAKRGIKAHGIEYNPDLVELSKRNAQAAGVADKATFANGDIFLNDFSQATVVTLFLLTDLNIRLRPTLLKMKPGTRVVSNTFGMGDWEPDEVVQAPGDCRSFCKASLWIVPAEAGGRWQLEDSVLELEQRYQTVAGKLVTGNVIAPVTKGKLAGADIAFTAGNAEYAGRVGGDAIEGTRKTGGTESKWRATRIR